MSPPVTCRPWNPVGMKNTDPYPLEDRVSPSWINWRYSYPWPSTKYRPIRKESTYHSRRPHLRKSQMLAVRLIWPRSTANTAAKNMSSEDSQTIVPTLTRFGLLAGERGGVFVADAVATMAIITTPRRRPPPDPPCRYDPVHEGRRLQS